MADGTFGGNYERMMDGCWLSFAAFDDDDLTALADDPRPMPISADCRAGVIDALRGLRDHARILADALPSGSLSHEAFEP